MKATSAPTTCRRADSRSASTLRDAFLFDVYKPKQSAAGMANDEKSFAVRLTLASNDATLTDEQIEAAVRTIVAEVASRTVGRLRG